MILARTKLGEKISWMQFHCSVIFFGNRKKFNFSGLISRWNEQQWIWLHYKCTHLSALCTIGRECKIPLHFHFNVRWPKMVVFPLLVSAWLLHVYKSTHRNRIRQNERNFVDATRSRCGMTSSDRLLNLHAELKAFPPNIINIVQVVTLIRENHKHTLTM